MGCRVATEEDSWVSGLGNVAALPLTKVGHEGKARTLQIGLGMSGVVPTIINN